MIAKLARAINGKPGQALLAAQTVARQRVDCSRETQIDPAARGKAAAVEAERRGLSHKTPP